MDFNLKNTEKVDDPEERMRRHPISFFYFFLLFFRFIFTLLLLGEVSKEVEGGGGEQVDTDSLGSKICGYTRRMGKGNIIF